MRRPRRARRRGRRGTTSSSRGRARPRWMPVSRSSASSAAASESRSVRPETPAVTTSGISACARSPPARPPRAAECSGSCVAMPANTMSSLRPSRRTRTFMPVWPASIATTRSDAVLATWFSSVVACGGMRGRHPRTPAYARRRGSRLRLLSAAGGCAAMPRSPATRDGSGSPPGRGHCIRRRPRDH